MSEHSNKITWRILHISLIVIVLLMLPICALFTFVMAFGADRELYAKIGYYFYYVEFFAFPILSVICYRKASNAYQAGNKRPAFILISIPLVIFVLSMMYFLYGIIKDQERVNRQWHAISTPKETSYICSHKPEVFITVDQFEGKNRYAVTRVDKNKQGEGTGFYYGYTQLQKESKLDLSKCKNSRGQRLEK